MGFAFHYFWFPNLNFDFWGLGTQLELDIWTWAFSQFISRYDWQPAHYNAALFRISWQITAGEGFRGPTYCGFDREEIPLQQFVQGNLEKEAGAIFARHVI